MRQVVFDPALFLIEAKQLYHLELSGGTCELALPTPALTEFIDFYWLLTIHAEHLDLTVVPDTAVDLVLSPDIFQFAALYFPVNEKFSIPLRGPVRYTGVCFKPVGATQLLGTELTALRGLNQGVETIEKLRIQSLTKTIQGVDSIGACATVFNQYWSCRDSSIGAEFSGDQRIDYSKLLWVLQESLVEDNIQALCKRLDISERQFRRISKDLFGLSPKQLQKIIRLQVALNELFTCESRQIADLYYDESHRIRELKQLTGLTPGNIRLMAEKYNQ